MWSAEAVTAMQARWKATTDLPFDDAVDAWTGLPASAREYTVTGLMNGTKYTFAVRYVTASGAGPGSSRERNTARSGHASASAARGVLHRQRRLFR